MLLLKNPTPSLLITTNAIDPHQSEVSRLTFLVIVLARRVCQIPRCCVSERLFPFLKVLLKGL
jgi:hypothetical protein